MAKYPIKQSLKNLSDIISKQVSQIESDLKSKATAYNSLKSNLQSIEKKQTGSLVTRYISNILYLSFYVSMSRNVADLVKKEHFVLDSEYLVTMLVVVPLSNINDWNLKYEKLTDMIVPRSSQLIYQVRFNLAELWAGSSGHNHLLQDNDHALVSITCFKKVADEFKQKARENKFVVRDFAYDEEQLKSGEALIRCLFLM